VAAADCSVELFWSARQEVSGSTEAHTDKEQIAGTVHPGTAHQTRSMGPAGSRPTAAATATDPLKEKTVPGSIHPLHGDVFALRDPQ
jgi:hypothetical protein